MATDQLEQFMSVISALESGRRDSSGNPIVGTKDYNAIGQYTGSTYGRARGAYQIMEKLWPGWAAEAGIPGADWRNPRNQERVASYKMRQYYQKYGRWDLVAIAWFAGPGRANTAAQKGLDAVGGLDDVTGTTVAKYVRLIQNGMGGKLPTTTSAQAGGQREEGGGRTEGTGTTSPMATPDTTAAPHTTGGQPAPQPEDPNVRRQRESELNQSTMESIMASISEAASAGGGKVLEIKSMFGDLKLQEQES